MVNFSVLWYLRPWDFFRQEYWSGLAFSPPGDLSDPGIKPMSPMSPALQEDSLPAESPRKLFDSVPFSKDHFGETTILPLPVLTRPSKGECASSRLSIPIRMSTHMSLYWQHYIYDSSSYPEEQGLPPCSSLSEPWLVLAFCIFLWTTELAQKFQKQNPLIFNWQYHQSIDNLGIIDIIIYWGSQFMSMIYFYLFWSSLLQ